MSHEDSEALRKKLYERRNAATAMECRGIQGAEEGLVATENFRTVYRDIAEDENLNAIALAMDAAQVQKGDARPHWERYEEIGSRIRGLTKDPVFRDAIDCGDLEHAATVAWQRTPRPTYSESNNSSIVQRMAEQRQRGAGKRKD